jgi:hypothetical protein
METVRSTSRRTLWAISWAVAAYVAASALPQLHGLIPGDAPSFYFAARMAATGDIERLYEPEAISEGWELLRAEGVHREAAKHENYFLRPAFSAYLYAPFGFLSFDAAWRLFSVLNACCAMAVAWKFPQWFGELGDGRQWTPWIFAYFPFVWAVGEGQDTILLTFCLGLALHLVMSGRETAGGIVAALLLVKPHLAWGAPLALLAAGRRKAFGAFAVSAAALLGVSAALVGPSGLRQWVSLLASPETDLVPGSMFNLRALALEAGPAPAMAVAGIVIASFLCVAWRGTFSDKLACGVLAPLLFSPHTYPQDLALAAILPFFAIDSRVRWAVFVPWLYLAPPGRGGNWIFLALSTAYLALLGFRAVRECAVPGKKAPFSERFFLHPSERA